MNDPWWRLPLWGGAAACAWMFLLWLVQLRTRNAGVVDFGWAASLGGLAVFYALAGPGDPTIRALVGVLGGAWGFRLALHLLFDRVVGHPEEGRYVELRRLWRGAADLHFIWFFQAQAALACLLSAPFLLAVRDSSPSLHPIQLGGVVLFAIGIVGEGIADRQLQRFKRDPANRGRVCRRGLWRYSRHPNYFFEWLIWCSFALLAAPAPLGWLAWGSPLALLLLILFVTGIPPTEAQSLRSRGEAYREYQRVTSPFFPLPPRTRAPKRKTSR